MRYFIDESTSKVIGWDETDGTMHEFTEICLQPEAEDKPAEDKPAKKRAYTKREKVEKSESKKRRAKVCKNCGGSGHMAKTCPEPSKDAENALEKMRFVPITPEKLHWVKERLKEGIDHETIATEVDMEIDRITSMAEQLGL